MMGLSKGTRHIVVEMTQIILNMENHFHGLSLDYISTQKQSTDNKL